MRKISIALTCCSLVVAGVACREIWGIRDVAPYPDAADDAGCEPNDPRFLLDAVSIDVSYAGFACAVLGNQDGVCWGALNKIGLNASPVPIKVISGVRLVRVSDAAACFLTSSGQARCVKSGCDAGLALKGQSNLTELGVGTNAVCGRTANKALVCDYGCGADSGLLVNSVDEFSISQYGFQYCYSLGQRIVCNTTPNGCDGSDCADRVFPDAKNPISVTRTAATACAVVGPDVYCAGRANSETLGPFYGDSTQTWTKLIVTHNDPIKQITGPSSAGCILFENGVVECAGSNEDGDLGQGSYSKDASNFERPLVVEGGTPLTGVREVRTGSCGKAAPCNVMAQSAFCALVQPPKACSTQVMCWGKNGLGQLGRGEHAGASSPFAAPVLAPR